MQQRSGVDGPPCGSLRVSLPLPTAGTTQVDLVVTLLCHLYDGPLSAFMPHLFHAILVQSREQYTVHSEYIWWSLWTEM